MKQLHTVLCLESILLCVLVHGFLCARSEYSKPDGSEDIIPALERMVINNGYPIETHSVTTEDDYILTVFRLPNPDTGKSPVFLQHAYHLYNKGYDVWVGNARGTQFSKAHKTYSTHRAEFWNFSFHEMGYYDIPAVLKHIQDTTGMPRVHYVAHSMGTTMFLVMATCRPQYVDLVHSVTFMAPVARPKHMGMIESSSRKKMLHLTTKALPALGVKGYQYSRQIGAYLHRHCGDGRTWLGKLCRSYMKGDDPKEFDHQYSTDNYWWYYDGTSFKNYRHFLQIAKAERFQQFDYESGNYRKYKSYIPPKYELRKIEKRIYILSGGMDNIAQNEDIKWLHHRLKNSRCFTENFEDFNHSTFNFGSKISEVHRTVAEIIEADEEQREPRLKEECSYFGPDNTDEVSSVSTST